MKNIEDFRNENGIIDLNKLNIQVINNNYFYYNKKRYFIKWADKILLLNELVAREIANDFGVSCVKYSYATFNLNENHKGDCVICTSAYEKSDSFFYLRELVGDNTTLEDIWNALELKFKDYNTAEKIINEIIDVFLFDILIANDDRHGDNLCIINNENGMHVAPIFDNEYMLCENSINQQFYSLKVDSGKTYYGFVTGNLDRFLLISENKYTDILNSKLWIISQENLDKIFKKIERQTGLVIDEDYKEGIKESFLRNYKMIERAIMKAKNPTLKRLI